MSIGRTFFSIAWRIDDSAELLEVKAGRSTLVAKHPVVCPKGRKELTDLGTGESHAIPRLATVHDYQIQPRAVLIDSHGRSRLTVAFIPGLHLSIDDRIESAPDHVVIVSRDTAISRGGGYERCAIMYVKAKKWARLARVLLDRYGDGLAQEERARIAASAEQTERVLRTRVHPQAR